MTKDQIIKEIQRTAKENGGKPPGQQRFRGQTTIKESDWRGRYWARWGDALREAGFDPNQFNQSYNDDVLLEKFAVLARELGRVPVVSEWQLKARRDKTYPSSSALQRLGSKQKLIARVLEFVRQREDYSDVVPLLSASASAHDIAIQEPTKRISTGLVYLMKSGRHYKIGRTVSVGSRERHLLSRSPFRRPPFTG